MSTSSLLNQSEYINNLLDDLKVENSLRFEPGELQILTTTTTTTEKFFAICDYLIQSITKYHDSDSMLAGDSFSHNSIDQVCYSQTLKLYFYSFTSFDKTNYQHQYSYHTIDIFFISNGSISSFIRCK